MVRLLCACVLLSSLTGCFYSITMEDPEGIKRLGEPRDSWDYFGNRTKFNDLTVTVAGKPYASSVRGKVTEELDGRRLIWVDADNNRHQLTANEVIPYVVHSSREEIPGDDVSTPAPDPTPANKVVATK